MTKKLLSLILVVLMVVSCFALASCGEEEKTSSENASSATSEATSEDASAETSEATSEDASAETSEATSEEASAETSEATSEEASAETSEATSEEASAETSEAASEEASAETSEEVSEEVSVENASSLEETKSYKYVSSINFNNGITAKLGVNAGFMTMNSIMSTDGVNGYTFTETKTAQGSEIAKSIIKNGKEYEINDAEKTYCCIGDADLSEMENYSVEVLFSDLTYVNTTVETIEGVTYVVDNFKTKSGNQDAKFYLDSEGKIKLAFMNGMVVNFEITEGADPSLFVIPDDYTEVEPDTSKDVQTNTGTTAPDADAMNK